MSRYDVLEIVDRANAFERLEAVEQDSTTLLEFTGLDEAEHVLTGLLPELHNVRSVVRDLDGQLKFVFENLNARAKGGVIWHQAPLIRENLVGDEEVGFALAETNLDEALVQRVLRALPSDPQHSLSM